MLNSKVTFQKHLDTLLKVIDSTHELAVNRDQITAPGYRLFWSAEELGLAENQVRLHFVIDQYKDSHDDLHALLERRQILDMMGLLKKPRADVLDKYTGLDPELAKYLGTIYLPKLRYVTDQGTAGDQSEVCMMHVKLLRPGRLWYEVPVVEAAPDIRHHRLDLVLESYDL